MEIKSIAVIGGGRMGRQIAMDAAIHGFPAVVYDLKEAVCSDVESWAEEYLAGRIAKGRLTEEQVAKVKARFRVERDLAKAVEGIDCVVEAVVEIAEVKSQVLRSVSDLVSEDTIIATNSSAMVSSRFAGDVKNPSRLCNMHYYNPALVMKFVEVVQGEHTAEETARACVEFCVKCGKKPAWMRKELPGFLGNYVYGGIAERAKYLVHHGYCSPQDVDIALEEGRGAKMGVFRTNDLTGIDLTLDMMNNAYQRTGQKPNMYDIYQQMVAEGRLGRKSGKGFYDYTGAQAENGPTLQEVPGGKVISSVAVVGGGRMGRQIAMDAAIHGFPAAVYDVAEAVCADVENWAEEYLAGRIAKGRLTEEQVAKVKELFRVERELDKAVAGADCIIEAVVENEKIKADVLRRISECADPDAVIATNSSVMVSSQFADVVKDPKRLCNMHYFFPALVMKFVEVVQGEHTDEDTARAAYNFCIRCGKKPVWMKKEIPGFLCNYVYSGLMERARYLVENGYCTPQDVDAAMEYGFNYKMGPFRTQDYSGFHVTLGIMEKQYAETGKKPDMYDYYKKMVAEGRLGKAAGKGFYDYT